MSSIFFQFRFLPSCEWPQWISRDEQTAASEIYHNLLIFFILLILTWIMPIGVELVANFSRCGWNFLRSKTKIVFVRRQNQTLPIFSRPYNAFSKGICLSSLSHNTPKHLATLHCEIGHTYCHAATRRTVASVLCKAPIPTDGSMLIARRDRLCSSADAHYANTE